MVPFDAFVTKCTSHTCHAPPSHLPRTYTKICLHSRSSTQPHQRSWFGSMWIFLRFTTGATNDSLWCRLMRLRPNAPPTLATHPCHPFPEHIRRFVCILDHAHSHTSDRGLVLYGYFWFSLTGATNDSLWCRLMRL